MILAIMVAYLAAHPEIIESIAVFPGSKLALIVALYLPFNLINALVLLCAIAPYAKHPRLWPILGITQIASLLNYVAPFRAAHVGSRALLLKQYFGVQAGHSVGTFLLCSLFNASVCVASLLVLMTTIDLRNATYERAIWWAAGSCAVGFAGIWAMALAQRWRFLPALPIPRLLTDVRDSLSALSAAQAVTLTALFVCQLLLGAYITAVLLDAIGEPTPFAVCVAMTAVGNLSLLISITPGNIGVKEITFIGVGNLFGVSPDRLLAALLVDRFVQIAVLALTSIVFVLTSRRAHDSLEST